MAGLAAHECFLHAPGCGGGTSVSGPRGGAARVSTGWCDPREGEGSSVSGFWCGVQTRHIMSKPNKSGGEFLCMDQIVNSEGPADYGQYLGKI